jgi:hypothetical protein
MKKQEFTLHQINDWKRFKEIRGKGKYNMISKEAQIATGIPEEQYIFVMENYEELAKSAQHIK